MLKKTIIFFLTCIIVATGSLIGTAEDSEPAGIKIYNQEIITNDIDATYIEGEIPVADGQDIVVTHGMLTIARKPMPQTSAPAKFRIKIPSSELDVTGTTSLRVRATEGNTERASLAARVSVTCTPREEQTISIDSGEYNLTLPGVKESVNAESSSGAEIIYASSNPDVVQVDNEGNLQPIGEGTANISVKALCTSRYDGAESEVSVKVESIDAYKVVFHSADGNETNDAEEGVSEQIIRSEESEPLQKNTFVNGDHSFLGWSTEDGGAVVYTDAQEVKDIAEKGEDVDLYAVWTGDGAEAALAWAINIANDDSFTYGTGEACHRIGCYFCGTNQKNKPKGYEKTYVCLTFVGAAYAHGAEDPEILDADRNGKMPMYENDNNFTRFSCWHKVGSCKNLTINDLKPGDVIIQWADKNDTGHVCMYAGGDKLVEAYTEGWGAKSIAVNSGAARRLRSLGSNGKNYVMRYKY